MSADPYSRLYHRFRKEFPDVWADDRALATWVRLLYIADASWPMDPPLPRSVRGKPLQALIDSGLVSLIGECYTMRGLNAERTRRKDAAARAAALRWHSGSNADALPRRTRDETSTNTNAEHSADAEDHDGRDDLEAFLLVTRRAPSPKQRKVLDDVLALRDLSGPSWAAQVILSNPDDPIGAVIREDKKWRDERIAAAKTQEHRPVRRPHRQTGMTGVNAELAKYYRELDRERAKDDVTEKEGVA